MRLYGRKEVHPTRSHPQHNDAPGYTAVTDYELLTWELELRRTGTLPRPVIERLLIEAGGRAPT